MDIVRQAPPAPDAEASAPLPPVRAAIAVAVAKPPSAKKERLRKKWIGLIDKFLTSEATTDEILDGADSKMDSVFATKDREGQWNDRFRELQKYKLEKGTCNVPQSEGVLGRWVIQQRANQKAGKLSDDRVARLDSIGFDFSSQDRRRRLPVPWETRFDELKEYKSQHGNCDVPQKDDYLGRFVDKQRQMYREGKLKQDRIDSLEAMGFEWGARTRSGAWEGKFEELKQYKEMHGHCLVPQVDGGRLGRWVVNQRQTRKQGKLPLDRIELLNSIDFIWNAKKTTRRAAARDWSVVRSKWEAKFDELKQYKEMHGHCRNLTTTEGGKLGQWVQNQRRTRKKGKLSPDKIDRLDSIDFIWAVKNAAECDANKSGETKEEITTKKKPCFDTTEKITTKKKPSFIPIAKRDAIRLKRLKRKSRRRRSHR